MNGKKPPHDPPHNPMVQKNNGLSSTQEVLYDKEFKIADNAVKNSKDKKDHNPKR